ncbi:hypothetical protein [Parapedobacter koreensis]|uniref:Uncharacterized protein n=1 Tax=Parapedobacter koreensis TaxID=332977 RepID=A0A1H7SIK6_9SPHI|nr:hypothetical protein [Parapedobacter koreensis]SEL72353.1 hypothetical protein SAMN05421740_1091 [Parapedobacter koreensis]
MATLIIESSDPKNVKLLTELAKRLGDRVKSISATETEDLLLGDLMNSVKTGEYVDKVDVMSALRS